MKLSALRLISPLAGSNAVKVLRAPADGAVLIKIAPALIGPKVSTGLQ